MRFVRRIDVLILALASAGAGGQSPGQKLTVTGKLVRVMAIGAESTGWSIELESTITVDNKKINSIEVRSHSASKLEQLANKQVKAFGKVVHRQGVETGEHPVLDISSIKEAKGTADTTPAQSKSQ